MEKGQERETFEQLVQRYPEMDEAARRRAVALAGHQGDEHIARAGLDDVLPVVRATALGALARLGALTLDDVARAAADDDVIVRARAAEVAPRALTPSADVPTDALVLFPADLAPGIALVKDPPRSGPIERRWPPRGACEVDDRPDDQGEDAGEEEEA